jgi:hypothetical protein
MNDYFRKWCCLLVIDHPVVNGKPENSLSASSIESITAAIESLGCAIYIYSRKPVEHPAVIWKSVPDADNTSLIATAFESAFANGFRKVILIDPDLPVTPYLSEAFQALKLLEYCIGPTEKGCYLVGMNCFEKLFFSNHPNPFLSDKKTLIKSIGQLRLALYKTPVLSDISMPSE